MTINTLNVGFVVLLVMGLAEAQETPIDPRAAQTHSVSPRDLAPWMRDLEVPDDPYVPVPRAGRPTTPAVRWVRGGYVSVQVNVDANGDNIVDDAANEPSIAVDPIHPTRMAIGWRQFDTITNNFRQAGWGYTQDGGQTWTFPGALDPGVFRSDPVLDFDALGNFYYNSLTTAGGYQCDVFKSTDGGVTWGEPVPAYGGDKQWMAIDRTGGLGHGNIYSFSRDGSSTTIIMTRSVDGGQSFEPPVNVPWDPGRGTITVDPGGVVYAAGRSFVDGEFVLARSTNAGDPQTTPVFEFSTHVDLGGEFRAYAGPNPGGLLGQTWVACDHSGGPHHGNVYVLSSVLPPDGDPLDVMFARSTDGGSTWSSPVRVNDVRSGWQWFGTMSVAPNGRIDVIWNDTRNDPGGYDSELHYAYSTDAGDTWSPNEVLSPAFDPHLGWPQQDKIGDYYDMISDEFGADVTYAATFNGEQDVYYLRIQLGPAPPVAWDIAVSTAVSTPVTITLDATDDGLPDPPAALTYIIASLPTHGDLADPGAGPITAVPYTLTSNGNQVEYQPEIGYHATDNFQFKANDGGVPPEGGDSNTAVVTVTMGGLQWDPVAYNVEWSTGMNVPTDIPLLGSDPNGDPLFYIIESLASAGDLSDPGAGPITTVPYELVGGGNIVHYEPPPGQNLQVTFDFSVRDATAGSNVATVTLMVGGPSIVYHFPMDTDPGWSTQGLWAFGQPTGGGGEFGGPDPTAGHFGDNVCGYNLNGDYTDNMPAQCLTTPWLDFTGATGVELRFWRWLGVESAYFDHAKLQVSNDPFGGSWTTLWENGVESMWDTEWTEIVFDLSAVADDQSAVSIRWVMGLTDGSNTYCGWNIDDVEIWALVAQPETCFDGIQNQGEDRIDCGGPCPPCDCTSNGECDDGLFCTGVETCDDYGHCQAGDYPCGTGAWCDEGDDACVPYGNGDFDGDGDVDLTDFAAFERCFNQSALGGCEPANLTGSDGTIDLDDFALFVLAMSGPL